MAQKDIHSFIVQFAEVMWVAMLNAARQSGGMGTDAELKGLDKNLSVGGWWKSAVGTIVADEVKNSWVINGKETPLSDYVKAEMEIRERKWQYYKDVAASEPNRAVELLTYQEIFCHNGKLITPKYIGLTCNRRASRFLGAMILRKALQDENGKPLEMDYTVPISVSNWSNEGMRIAEQVHENVGVNQAKKNMSVLDMLFAARNLIGLGANQNKIRTLFGEGQGIKLYHTILLAAKFPGLRILERAKLEPGQPGYYPLASVKFPVLQGFAQRLDEKSLAEYNAKAAKQNKAPVGLVSEEEVAAYFQEVTKDPTGNEDDRALDKNGIANIATVNPNPFAKITANRIRNTKDQAAEAKLTRIGVMAPACECLIVLDDQNDYVKVEPILDAIVKLPAGKQRDKALKAIAGILNIEVPGVK